MLTIGRHGTRRTPPLTPDRGSCYVSLLERPPTLHGRQFLLSTHDELGEYRVHIPLSLVELQILADQIAEHLDAQTIEENVPATEIRLGDIITGLNGEDVCVWGLGNGSPTPSGFSTVLIDYQDREGRQGTFVAIEGGSFTVRVPRPPAVES